jgi:hypothetical protein
MKTIKPEAIPAAKFALVRIDDWEALYIDGEMAYEGHQVRPTDVFRALGLEVEGVVLDEAVAEREGYEFGFPNELDVVREAIKRHERRKAGRRP